MGMDNALFAKPKAGQWTMESVPGRGWRLVDPEGRPQPAFYTRERAKTALQRRQDQVDVAGKRLTRPCLRCQTPFLSEGIHNRMCNRCRGLNADGWDPHGIAPRHGRAR